MPYIVIVVDEFADLMTVARKEIEPAVQRLAQMARAAGIHLVMATQRPSSTSSPGLKADFPTRISFKVASKIGTRTILNDQGARQLLGQGDMLGLDGCRPTVRAHGAPPRTRRSSASRSPCATRVSRSMLSVTEPPAPVEAAVGAPGARSTRPLRPRRRHRAARPQGPTSYVQRRLSIG